MTAVNTTFVDRATQITASWLNYINDKVQETASAADFGILTNDDPTSTLTKINAALTTLSTGNRPRTLAFLDKSDWYNINNPMIMKKGVSISGIGGRYARIKNDNAYNFYSASIISPGNFHPQYVAALPTHDVGTITAGATNVVLTTPSQVSNYSVGSQVVIQSNEVYVSSGFNIPRYIFLNEVVGISGATLYLKYDVDQTFAGKISVINGSVLARNNVPLFFWQDGKVEFMEFSTVGYVHSDTATLNCSFENVYYRGRSAIYGNTFQRTTWNNVRGRTGTFAEMSLGSLDCQINNIDLSHDPLVGAPTGSSMWGFQENTRNISVQNGTLDIGTYTSGAAFFNLINTENNLIRNIDVTAGANFTGAVVQYAGAVATGKLPCRDNVVSGIRARGQALSRYYLISGDGVAGGTPNNTIEKSKFYGTVSTNECGRFVTCLDRNVLTDNYFENGRPLIDGTSTGLEITDNFITAGFTTTADPDTYTRCLIKNNRTATTIGRQPARSYSTALLTQSGTTALNLINANLGTNISVRDTISFEIRGNITGTNNTKTVTLQLFNNTDTVAISLGSKVFAAGTTGPFVIRGSVYFAQLNSYTYIADIYTDAGTVREMQDVSVTTDITGKSISFQAIAVCTNAGDGMTFRKVTSDIGNPVII